MDNTDNVNDNTDDFNDNTDDVNGNTDDVNDNTDDVNDIVQGAGNRRLCRGQISSTGHFYLHRHLLLKKFWPTRFKCNIKFG